MKALSSSVRLDIFGLCLTVALAAACSFDTSQLRAPASRAPDGAVEHPAVSDAPTATGGSGGATTSPPDAPTATGGRSATGGTVTGGTVTGGTVTGGTVTGGTVAGGTVTGGRSGTGGATSPFGGGGSGGGAVTGGRGGTVTGGTAGGSTGGTGGRGGGVSGTGGGNGGGGGGPGAGGSTGRDGGGGAEPCVPAATVTGSSGSGNSGFFGTASAYCFRTPDNINGWGCTNCDGRTLKVNGVAKDCGNMPLPAKVNGYYYFDCSAGTYSYASIYWW